MLYAVLRALLLRRGNDEDSSDFEGDEREHVIVPPILWYLMMHSVGGPPNWQ